MKKSTIVTFILSVMVFATIGAISIILIMPDSRPDSYVAPKYEQLQRGNYTYVQTKNITLESIEQRYEVNQDYLNK
ncbi:MAG: hypothetical protein RSB51_01980, partial [Clostridia bacterium]